MLRATILMALVLCSYAAVQPNSTLLWVGNNVYSFIEFTTHIIHHKTGNSMLAVGLFSALPILLAFMLSWMFFKMVVYDK